MTQLRPLRRTAIFDIVRTIVDRGLTQSEVDAINGALDDILSDRNSASRSNPTNSSPADTQQRIGPNGIALIKRFEGCGRRRPDGMIEAYPDPGTGGDPWTIGWGATGRGIDGSAPIGPGTQWSQEQCDARLASDLERYAAEVAEAIGSAPTSQSQFDALVSFHYNTGAIGRATLTRKHRAGDYSGAAAEFERWNRAGGRVMPGLVRRRRAEAQLYRE